MTGIVKGLAYFQNLLNLSPAARYFFSLVVVLLCLNGCAISTEPVQTGAVEDTAKIEQAVGVYSDETKFSSEVGVVRASTQTELLSRANSKDEKPSTSAIIGPAKNSELENEIQNYIAIFNGDEFYNKKRAMSGLAWSGIADARLFDILEADLLDRYQAKTRAIVGELSYLVKALSYSGMEKYRPAISTVANGAAARKLSGHASNALIRLARYQQWNPIILLGVDDAAPGKLNELRVYNMLRSNEPQLIRIGAKKAYASYLGNDRILAATNQSAINNYDKNLDQVYQIDGVLWLMKVLAASGRPEYKETLEAT